MSEPSGSSLAETKISALFDAAASTEPIPGGGCVSAVCGYLGISLLLKSIRVSARKQTLDKAYAAVEQQLIDLSSKLLALAQADADSFQIYIQALRLPKGTPLERATRDKALHDASVTATIAALNILETGNAVLDSAHQVQFRVLSTIRADEKACVELISAMNTTSEENATTNLATEGQDDALRKRLSDAIAQHAALLAACHSA